MNHVQIRDKVKNAFRDTAKRINTASSRPARSLVSSVASQTSVVRDKVHDSKQQVFVKRKGRQKRSNSDKESSGSSVQSFEQTHQQLSKLKTDNDSNDNNSINEDRITRQLQQQFAVPSSSAFLPYEVTSAFQANPSTDSHLPSYIVGGSVRTTEDDNTRQHARNQQQQQQQQHQPRANDIDSMILPSFATTSNATNTSLQNTTTSFSSFANMHPAILLDSSTLQLYQSTLLQYQRSVQATTAQATTTATATTSSSSQKRKPRKSNNKKELEEQSDDDGKV
jgi:hypothetical protein